MPRRPHVALRLICLSVFALSAGLPWVRCSIAGQPVPVVDEVRAGEVLRTGPLPRADLNAPVLGELRESDVSPAAGPATKSRRAERGFRALYIMNRDGSDVRCLLAVPGMLSTATPEWSHDGKMIACDAMPRMDGMIDSRVFVVAIAGPFKGMAKDYGYGNTPTWSPDDSQMAYMLNAGNPAGVAGGVWVMNSDGTGRRHVCDGMYPRWSPTGDRLCVHHNGNLLIRSLKTDEERYLLPPEVHAEFAGGTWSPTGDRVVFIALRDDKQHIATIDVERGIESLKIIYTAENPRQRLVGPPSWSPDGKKFIFAIQDLERPQAEQRLWMHTHLYSLWAELPNPPTLVEGAKVGVINRGMNWSRDGRKIIFSSER